MLGLYGLRKTLYPLLSTGSTQEDRKCPDMTEKNVDWAVKHWYNQTQRDCVVSLSKTLHYLLSSGSTQEGRKTSQ